MPSQSERTYRTCTTHTRYSPESITGNSKFISGNLRADDCLRELANNRWAQSNDTGQEMWSGMNLTAVSMSGSNATYTCNTLAGLALAVGRALTITVTLERGRHFIIPRSKVLSAKCVSTARNKSLKIV